MKIIKPATVHKWARSHPAARPSLAGWLGLVQAGSWRNFKMLRTVFPQADQVKVASGRNVVVFNISGNKFRLIAAVHFNTQIVFALRFMTHAEYSKDQWKETL